MINLLTHGEIEEENRRIDDKLSRTNFRGQTFNHNLSTTVNEEVGKKNLLTQWETEEENREIEPLNPVGS